MEQVAVEPGCAGAAVFSTCELLSFGEASCRVLVEGTPVFQCGEKPVNFSLGGIPINWSLICFEVPTGVWHSVTLGHGIHDGGNGAVLTITR